MRRNVIASVLLITLMLASFGAMVYAQVTVQIGTPSSPNDLGITTPQGYWIGEFPITINANTGEAYCLTPSGTVYEGSSYTADEVSVPTDNAIWQAISYVLSWNAPTDATSAAIDQVALWQLLGDNPPYADFTLDSSITTPAATLAADARGKNTALPTDTLTWTSPSSGAASVNPGYAVSFLVQLNSKRAHVQIDFTATLTPSGGSPTPLPSADVSPSMAFTDSDGRAQVSVTVPSDAPVGSAITVTAHTQSVWPTEFLDLINYNSGAQNLMGVGPALDLTTSSSASVSQSLTVFAPNTILSLVPSTNINIAYPAALPSTFSVQVNIANGQSVWGDNIVVSWNPAVLSASSVTKGTYLSSVDSDAAPAPVITSSSVTFSDVLLSTKSANGAGTLFTITFSTIGFGSGTIGITSAKLLDPTSSHNIEAIAAPLPSIPLNNPTSPPTAPVAAFTVAASPATISGTFLSIPVGASSTSITLDDPSTPGFDGNQIVPVNGWSWTIHSVNGKFADLHPTTQTVTLTSVVADQIVVSLTVSATEASPPPGYVSTSAPVSVTYTINQIQATGIDVYTQTGGAGPNANSGPFGPQQNIVATASVISNGAPVASKLVNFEVYDNNGNQFAFLTASTNGQGIASVDFRLPTMDTGVEQGFGSNWKVVATVDVSEVQYVDICKFTFSYLVNIGSVTPSPTVVARGVGTTTISAQINNMVLLNGVQVTFTVVDCNNVPIACADVVSTLVIGNNNIVAGALHIPNWAFVGQAKINVNVIKPLGLPYCPQNGETIAYYSNGHYLSAVQNQPTQFSITL